MKKLLLLGSCLLMTSLLGLALDVDVSGSNVMETRVEKVDYTSNPDASQATVVDHMLIDLLVGNNFRLGTEVDTRQPRRSKFSSLEEYSASILDQFHIVYTDDIANITAGHYSATLGRGLSLRAYRDDDLEYDHTLIGAYSRITPIQQIEFAMLSGQHLRADESATEKDNVQGAELILRPWQFIYLGGSVGNERKLSPTNYHDTILIPGGYLGCKLWKFMLYGEVTEPNWMTTSLNPTTFAMVKTNSYGHGRYGNLQFNYPGVGISLQYKDYLKENGDYTSPPPCTHSGNSVNEGADEKGYMGEVTASPIQVLQVYGGYSSAKNTVVDLPANLTEYWGGGQFNGVPDLILNADYTHSKPYTTVLPNVWVIEQQDIPSLEASLVIAHVHTGSVSIAYEMRHDRNQSLDLDGNPYVTDDKYYYIRPSLSYSYASRVYATLDYERTDLKPTSTLPNQPKPKTQWLFGTIRYVITDQHSLTVGYGSRRGGKVCSGGMCRQEAPFEGLQVNLTSSF